MQKLRENEILEEIQVCPYCMNIPRSFSCCGENHFENAYLTVNDEVFLESEVEIIGNELTQEEIDDIKGSIQYDIEKDK